VGYGYAFARGSLWLSFFAGPLQAENHVPTLYHDGPREAAQRLGLPLAEKQTMLTRKIWRDDDGDIRSIVSDAGILTFQRDLMVDNCDTTKISEMELLYYVI